MVSGIPTNIITGFLGVGKTTAIRHLLEHKPEGEVWSVLVNEFGEIGIDGALLKGTGAHVREVPGGCICCVGNLPMKVALNMLIATTKPDRILVEPTGLGHPAEIIATLTGEYYREVLNLRATITLVDVRKLADSRYTDNTVFHDQLNVADVLIGNKEDQYAVADYDRFVNLVASFNPPKLGSQLVSQGAFDPSWLNRPRGPGLSSQPDYHSGNRLQPQQELPNPEVEIPQGESFIRRENRGQKHYSLGWAFVPERHFNFNNLFALLSGLAVARAKAIAITDQGVFSFNMEGGVLSVGELDDALDSRIELIDAEPIAVEAIERELLAAAGLAPRR